MREILVSKSFLSLTLQNFLAFCSLNIFNVIPDYLATLGANRGFIGMFMNVNSLVLVLLVIPLSRFTDNFGRKKLLIAGYCLAILSFALSFIFPSNLWFLAAMRLVGSLAFCAYFTIHTVEVFELLPRDRRMAGMGIFGISGLLSNPVSAEVGQLLLKYAKGEDLFLAALGFCVLAFIICIRHEFHSADRKVEQGAFVALFKRPELFPLIILALLQGGSFTIYASFLANLSRERLGEVQVSVFSTAFTAIAIFSRLVLTLWLERLKKSSLAAIAFGLIAISFGMTWFLSETWQLIPIGLVFGLGFSVVSPLMSSVFVNSGAEHEKLALNNLYLSVNTFGNVAFALGLGILGDALGLPWIFLSMGIFVCAALPFAWWGIKAPRL